MGGEPCLASPPEGVVSCADVNARICDASQLVTNVDAGTAPFKGSPFPEEPIGFLVVASSFKETCLHKQKYLTRSLASSCSRSCSCRVPAHIKHQLSPCLLSSPPRPLPLRCCQMMLPAHEALLRLWNLARNRKAMVRNCPLLL